jgi:hypothetical protein
MEIHHLAHNEIDFQKWDSCIQNACNTLVYAESWYLDVVSPNWEALIAGDYDFVMPLPVKRKFGILFLVQPPLTQQLGIFSANSIDENIVSQFIQKIPYISYHLNLNEKNLFSKSVKRKNFILKLDKDYSTLASSYSSNTKRNVKNAFRYTDVIINTDISLNEFWKLYESTEKNYKMPPDTYIFELTKKLYERNRLTVSGVLNLDNEMIAGVCWLHSPSRLIYLVSASNKEGKDHLAMFKMVDEIIKKYANSTILLDFAGSNINSIARFYKGFGAKLYDYYEIKRLSINDFIKRFCFWK